MGLVKTRRLAAMQKQITYAKATVVKQRAKAGAWHISNWGLGGDRGQRLLEGLKRWLRKC